MKYRGLSKEKREEIIGKTHDYCRQCTKVAENKDIKKRDIYVNRGWQRGMKFCSGVCGGNYQMGCEMIIFYKSIKLKCD